MKENPDPEQPLKNTEEEDNKREYRPKLSKIVFSENSNSNQE